MLRVIKLLLILIIVIAAVVIGYAYLGDLTPERGEVSEPVVLDGLD